MARYAAKPAVLLLMAILVAMCRPADAQPGALDVIRATGVVRFGVTGDYPPFADKTADGGLVGADIDAARRVASDLGARPEFVMTSWQTLTADFSGGGFDIAIGGLTVTPDRAALGVFSVPLLEDGKRPLARCSERTRYETLAAIDSPGTRLMINRGPAIAELVKQWFSHVQATVHTDDATLTDQLLENRMDVWITDGVVVDMMARRYPGKLCATTLVPFTHVTKAWLIRGDPHLVAQVNRSLNGLISSGEWQRNLDAVH